MITRTTEFQIKNYHVFIENTNKPCFGWHRDDEGVFCILFYRLRFSVYGRRFNRTWKHH